MNYIYMAIDNWRQHLYDFCEPSAVVYFKVGFSKDPKRRGYQISSEAKRHYNIPCELATDERYWRAVSDSAREAKKIEAFVLKKVKPLSIQCIGNEYFLITRENREYCYNHLDEWIKEFFA